MQSPSVIERLVQLLIIVAVIAAVVLFVPRRSQGAEPPRFAVENKMPRFQVVNRIGAAQPLRPIPYAELYQRVGAGERIIALVNLPAADRQSPVVPAPTGWVLVRCDDIPETPPGRWKLFLDASGRFTMEEITGYTTASGVAVKPRFTERPAMRGTDVSSAGTSPHPVLVLDSSGAIYPVANTYTDAITAALYGNTNCVGFK